MTTCLRNSQRRDHIAIVGGGLIGMTTAWALAQRGHRVTLLETEAGAASGTSGANGGMLHVSHTEPWNAPGITGVFLRALIDPAAPVVVHPGALLRELPWAFAFLHAARRPRFAANVAANAALARHSLATLRRWKAQLPERFDYRDSGILKLFYDQQALAAQQRASQPLAAMGIAFQSLDAEACVAREPQLAAVRDAIAGGLWFPDDAIGDARSFVLLLQDALQQHADVRIHTRHRVHALRLHRGRCNALITSEGPIAADAVVVANGCDARRLLAGIGVRIAVAPVRGYSLTLPGDALPGGLTTPIIDDAHKVVITPLGRTRLRIAGGADIAGSRRDAPPQRLQTILDAARKAFPALPQRVDPETMQPWAGLRPMAARGRPLIGASRVPGVWVNAGPGHLGWTFAAGAADLIAACIDGDPAPIDPAPYALHD